MNDKVSLKHRQYNKHTKTAKEFSASLCYKTILGQNADLAK